MGESSTNFATNKTHTLQSQSKQEEEIEMSEQHIQLGLNIFYSDIKYTEKVWVRLKVRHHPLQHIQLLTTTIEQTVISMLGSFCFLS